MYPSLILPLYSIDHECKVLQSNAVQQTFTYRGLAAEGRCRCRRRRRRRLQTFTILAVAGWARVISTSWGLGLRGLRHYGS